MYGEERKPRGPCEPICSRFTVLDGKIATLTHQIEVMIMFLSHVFDLIWRVDPNIAEQLKCDLESEFTLFLDTRVEDEGPQLRETLDSILRRDT